MAKMKSMYAKSSMPASKRNKMGSGKGMKTKMKKGY